MIYNTSILHPRFVSWLSAGTSAHYQVRWACPAHSAAYELESCCLPNLPNYELTEAAITAPRGPACAQFDPIAAQ